MSESFDLQASASQRNKAEAPDAQPLNLSRCLNEAIDIWKKNWLVLALAAFLFTSLCFVSLFILAGPLCAGVSFMTLEALRRGDKEIVLGDMFRELSFANAAERFLPLVGLYFLTTAAAIVGLFVCVVPGLLLMTWWLYCYYLVVDKGLAVFASLRVSKDIVSYKGFWTNLLLVLIGVAVELGMTTIPYAGLVLGFFVSPIAWLMISSAYIQIVDEDSGLLHDLIKAELACTEIGS